MKKEGTALASVYTTSPLEHHHFNQTITILQVRGGYLSLKKGLIKHFYQISNYAATSFLVQNFFVLPLFIDF